MADSSYKKIIRLFLWAAGIILFLYLFYLLTDIIIILAFSVLLAFIFAPLVRWIESKGFNRPTSTLFTFAIFGFFVYLSLSLVIPELVFEMNQLVILLEGFSFEEEMKVFEQTIITHLPFFQPGELTLRAEEFVTNQVVNSVESLTTLITSIVSIVAVLLIVPFITFFLLKDNKKILQSIMQIIPNKTFEMSYWVLKKVTFKLGLFVRAWIFDATFVGVMIGFGFFFIGLPNALPLGVIAGLGHLIPYF
ncbi:MAG TPA: AI-2E family transporter, partial [Ignavibacteriaceae bacterium]